jgi:hypothetical protein
MTWLLQGIGVAIFLWGSFFCGIYFVKILGDYLWKKKKIVYLEFAENEIGEEVE